MDELVGRVARLETILREVRRDIQRLERHERSEGNVTVARLLADIRSRLNKLGL